MRAFCATVLLLLPLASHAGEDVEQSARELQRFEAPEARQAVAVDAEHFYAIVNSRIGKYDKASGERVLLWEASEAAPLRHLNSGVVLGDKLYCCNSNFPHYPETSSIEIFDCDTLEHVGTHSFGIYEGSLTWVDRHAGAWWAVFAHYSEQVNNDPRAKPHTYTTLVKFDDQWRRMAGWVFPAAVLERFAPHSCSGGGWGPDGALYVTGHDHGELYRLELPKAGSTLVHTATIQAPITGQGVAWDRSEPGVLYGIDRPRGEVIAVRVPSAAESIASAQLQVD
ncbi:hypothetical protein Mal64_00450 [Pseudobythopirellula maris]|uniref:SMP-30/Gluconolaconase/LRE-like region n=1 Tax=Pseudobythopirellula maris TaxID=2527991 RepID=A0A5C5ZR16_9BACT|nr:hypothetical protein [Pseudobythopirellula maris]TWT89666.1 hypothetical protein Mal64_00450 [Pseudobythopirellula maris]